MAAKKSSEDKSVKKQKESLPRDERAALLMEMVNKKMRGRAVLMSASDYVLPWQRKRIPTGILTLDLELRGGFPCGGLSQIVGRRNAGKSMMAWHCIRQLQHFIGDKMMVLLAMTEGTADRTQARRLGVRIDLSKEEIDHLQQNRKIAGLPPLKKEELNTLFPPQVGTIHELHALAVEDFYDVILEALASNTYHLIVIDSIGNALSNAETENESVHDKTYGGTSAPNTTFLKKMTNLLTMKTEWGEVRDTALIGINQVRDNIKDPNAPYKSPGGNALEHAKLVDLYVESGKALGDEVPVYTPEGWKQRFVMTGKEVNWKIVKGKAGMHEGGRGSFVFDRSTDNVDFYLDYLMAGITHGVIETAGAWLGVRDPENPAEYIGRANGRDAFIELMKKDAIEKAQAGDSASILNHIRDQCFKKLGIDIRYEDLIS